MDKMDFQFYITEEDYLAFNQYSLLNSKHSVNPVLRCL